MCAASTFSNEAKESVPRRSGEPTSSKAGPLTIRPHRGARSSLRATSRTEQGHEHVRLVLGVGEERLGERIGAREVGGDDDCSCRFQEISVVPWPLWGLRLKYSPTFPAGAALASADGALRSCVPFRTWPMRGPRREVEGADRLGDLRRILDRPVAVQRLDGDAECE